MLANLDYLRDRLHKSFWLVPGTMTIAAIAAAPGMLWLDTTPLGVAIGQWSAPSAVGAEGARLVLSTIAGSMITVASLVFSMTLVAMTLAASSWGGFGSSFIPSPSRIWPMQPSMRSGRTLAKTWPSRSDCSKV